MVTDQRSRSRQVNESIVYELLLENGATTRTDLARRASLSKPSISGIIESFVAAGICRPAGTVQGRSGPAATLFEIEPTVSHGIGIDLGGTKIHGVIGDLTGEVLHEQRVPTDRRGGSHVVEQIAELCRGLAAQLLPGVGAVHHVAIGSPGIVDPATGLMKLAYNLPDFDRIDLAKELEGVFSAAVHVDNDVNMAAEGERFDRSTTTSDNFVYLSVGTGIGSALVLDGRICRGHRGAAGEISYLPIGTDPFDPDNQVRGPLEEAVDGNAMLQRFTDQHGRVPSALAIDATVPDIFRAATDHDPLGVKMVDEEARLLALAITAVSALLDPERVILGGGIGSSEALLPEVRAWCNRLMPEPPVVQRSLLGNRAPLIGALGIAVTAAREDLLETCLRGRSPSRLAWSSLSSVREKVSGSTGVFGMGRGGSC